MQLVEIKVSKNVCVLCKTSKLINSKCLRSVYFSFIHCCINYANIAWTSTNKTKLMFNQDRFTDAPPSLIVYRIGLLPTPATNIWVQFLYVLAAKTLCSSKWYVTIQFYSMARKFQNVNENFSSSFRRIISSCF